MTSNQRSLWNKVAPAIKRALLGARPDAAGLPAAARLPAARPLALEQRFMFDAAAVAATADAAHAARPEAARRPRRNAPMPLGRPTPRRPAPTRPAWPWPRKRRVARSCSWTTRSGLPAAGRAGPARRRSHRAGQDPRWLCSRSPTLRGRSGIDAIHIIGHGAEGSMRLGSVELNAAALGGREPAGRHRRGADRAGRHPALWLRHRRQRPGAELLSRLAQLTHADVAASNDRTARRRLVLEAVSGSVETAALSFALTSWPPRPARTSKLAGHGGQQHEHSRDRRPVTRPATRSSPTSTARPSRRPGHLERRPVPAAIS